VPRLDVYQSLWAMDPGRGSHDAHSTEEQFALVKNAGFAGMAINLGAADRKTAYKTMPLFRQYELGRAWKMYFRYWRWRASSML